MADPNHTQGATLDRLIDLATWSAQSPNGQSGKIALNTALMWKILDYRTSRQLPSWNTGLFHSSFPDFSPPNDHHEETTVDEPSCQNPTQGPRALTRDVADSPAWFAAIASPSERPDKRVTGSQMSGETQNFQDQASSSLDHNTQTPDWTWSEDVNRSTFMDVQYDFFTQPFDLDGSNSSRWDFGIL
jgi:hypothetical protein